MIEFYLYIQPVTIAKPGVKPLMIWGEVLTVFSINGLRANFKKETQFLDFIRANYLEWFPFFTQTLASSIVACNT